MEKPILFNTEMVRAILDGRKTQTRRLPSSRIRDAWLSWDEYQCAVAPPGSILETEEGFYKKYPPYKEGDILYVRETWKQATGGTAGPGLFDTYLYKADEPQDTMGMMVEGRWHPSIHMPKAAARIYLNVKRVRLERLKDITEEDAVAEGFEADEFFNARARFAMTWNSVYGASGKKVPENWASNPWVWVIEFENALNDHV